MEPIGFGVGILFGAALFLSGLADPDKIIGAMRLKDFHAMRVIGVFVLVGMAGTYLLSLFGLANVSIKPTIIVSLLVGGGLLGIGFGAIGYCPGTALASAGAGRKGAVGAILGMLLGAGAYIWLYPAFAAPLDDLLAFGKQVLPEVTPIPYAAWVVVFVAAGTLVLWLTRPRPQAARQENT